MTYKDQQTRLLSILTTMDDIKKSTLSIQRYFKDNETPFNRAQYYNYRRILEEKGVEALIDQRSEGNNLKFTIEMKSFAKGILNNCKSLTSLDVQEEIKKEFGTIISETTINEFRRENNLTWMRPIIEKDTWNDSGASELIIALALKSGLIDALANRIVKFVNNKKESNEYIDSFSIEGNHIELRSNGKFTKEYNNSIQVRESRFKALDEKIPEKRFASMKIFSLSPDTIRRYCLAIFSLPLVTYNGKIRNVNSPRGNALKYLCNFNYKMATLDKYTRELKYLQISNELIDETAKFWINFWAQRKKSDNIFVCYYIDGNTKALWSSKPCYKGKVTMMGRVMNCLEQVFIHDGQGHPLYFQTFNGHADLGKNALRMIDKVTGFLNETTNIENQFSINRILIMDANGNGVKTLREISNSPYHYITILDLNQVNDRKIKNVYEEKRYDYGDANLIDCKIDLEDSKEKGYIFETRAVQVNWDNGKTSVLITSLPKELFPTDNVVKSYFDRWPFQELGFKNMKSGVNIHRIVGFGKKLVDNKKVIDKIEKLKEQLRMLEKELECPQKEIVCIEKDINARIQEERIYREKSKIVDGKRVLSKKDTKRLKEIQKKINKNQRKIKLIEKDNERKFKLLKEKRAELVRITDKKKIYHVDVELDQIMTCFKISFANVCCYLLEECFNGECLTIQRLFEDNFELQGKMQLQNGERTVLIERNPKQDEVMMRLEPAIDSINNMMIKDLKGNRYNISLV